MDFMSRHLPLQTYEYPFLAMIFGLEPVVIDWTDGGPYFIWAEVSMWVLPLNWCYV